MGWRFLECFEQRRLSALREHVHFVEDVHLVPTRRTERRLLDEIAHSVDAVVTCCVKFVYVVAGASLDGEARGTFAAWFTFNGIGAIEDLGQDPRRRRLSSATWPAEQVTLSFAVVDDCVTKGTNDVLLPAKFAEAARAVAAVKRLSGHWR